MDLLPIDGRILAQIGGMPRMLNSARTHASASRFSKTALRAGLVIDYLVITDA
jgi:hypothetical protein